MHEYVLDMIYKEQRTRLKYYCANSGPSGHSKNGPTVSWMHPHDAKKPDFLCQALHGQTFCTFPVQWKLKCVRKIRAQIGFMLGYVLETPTSSQNSSANRLQMGSNMFPKSSQNRATRVLKIAKTVVRSWQPRPQDEKHVWKSKHARSDCFFFGIGTQDLPETCSENASKILRKTMKNGTNLKTLRNKT